MRIRLAVLLLFATVSASAQRLHEHITVDLIEVPVHVTRNGKAVADLTKQSFELYVNGKRHPIEYFDVVDERLPAGEAAGDAPQVLDRRRLIVLLFDITATTRRSVMRAKEAAMKFVSEARPGDTFAVAVMARSGANFIIPFTDDHVAVQRAILTLTPSRAGDALSLATLPAERALWISADFAGSGEPNGGNLFPDFATFRDHPFSSADDFAAVAYQAEKTAEGLERADIRRKFVEDLGDLAERLAPIAGVKHVVLLSDGTADTVDQTHVRMHNRFRAAGVILNAVELQGAYVPNTPFSSFREGFSSLLGAGNESASLYNFALDTGGAVARHGDIAEGLRFIRNMQSVTYILAFRPPPDAKSHNTISVRVRNEPFGTTLNYRRGFSKDPQGDRSDGLFLADILMNDIPQRGLTLDVDVVQQGETASIIASVPGPEVLAHVAGDEDAGLVDVFLYIFDEKDLVVGWGYWRLRIDVEKGREFLAASPFTVQQQFSLGSGHYSAKALLRFVDTGVSGFRRSDFEIVSK